MSTTRVNEVQGLYPSGFYAVMSVLVGPDVDRSVVSMRLLNGLLAAVVLGLIVWLAPLGVAAAALLSVAVSFVPLGLFVVPSTNPSAWAVVGVLGVWAFAMSWLAESDGSARWRRWTLGAGTVVTAAMAIGSRADASAFVVLALALATLLVVRSRAQLKQQRGRLAVLATVAVVAVFVYLSLSAASLVGPIDETQGTLGRQSTGVGLLLTNLVSLPDLFAGIVGGWGLGWLDTPMPPLVSFVGVLAIGMVLFRGLQAADRRTLLATALAAAALVAVPLVFLQSQRLAVGQMVQPRYLLPLLVLLLATVSVPMGPPAPMRRLVAVVFGLLLSSSAVLAFWTNAHRYAIGTDVPLFDRDPVVEWGPLLGWPLPVVVAVTATATVAFIGGALALSTKHPAIAGSLRQR